MKTSLYTAATTAVLLALINAAVVWACVLWPGTAS